MKILVFADLHFLPYELLMEMPKWDKSCFNAIAFLGDIDFMILKYLAQTFRDIPMFGVLGNHDYPGDLEELNIPNLHNQVINLDNLRIGGIEGSIRYKKEKGVMLSHEESLLIAVTMSKTDILLTHTSPYGYHERIPDIAHKGLLGINKYIELNSPQIVLHGHQHWWQTTYLENGTKIAGIYGIALVDTQDLSVKTLVDLSTFE